MLTPDGPELVKEELGVVGSEFGGVLAKDVENGVVAPDGSRLAIAPGLVKEVLGVVEPGLVKEVLGVV